MHNRPRILALCGARSNDEVTKLQLENLRLTDDVCDIIYLHGDIEVERDSSEVNCIVHGPFYSWFDTDNEHILNESVINSVRHVLIVIKTHGPFDGVYGFSNGGLIAALVAGIADDTILNESIKRQEQGHSNWLSIINNVILPTTPSAETVDGATGVIETDIDRAFDLLDTDCSGGLTAPELLEGLSRIGVAATKEDIDAMISNVDDNSDQVIDRAEFHAMFRQSRTKSTIIGGFSTGEIMLDQPFKFCILARAGLSPYERLDSIKCSSRFLSKNFTPSTACSSIHLIATDDKLKSQSEDLACMFTFETSHIYYSSGGHGIGREVSHDNALCSSIKIFVKSLGNPSHVPLLADFKPVSEVSSLSVHPRDQIAHVQVNQSLLQGGDTGTRYTIIGCLAAQPGHKAFIYNARYSGRVKSSQPKSLVEHHKPLRASIATAVTGVRHSFRMIPLKHPPTNPRNGVALPRYTSMPEIARDEGGGDIDKRLSASLRAPVVHPGVGVDDTSISKHSPSEKSPSHSYAIASFAIDDNSNFEKKDGLMSSFSSAGDQTSVCSSEESPSFTTYGDVLQFIQHGEGDLRKIGIKPGEVVSYCAPGASSVAAIAFLAFGAQTTSAPLSPGMTEPDAYDALEQFHAMHLILFDGVHCPGVTAAFERYAKEGKGVIHKANGIDPFSPGLFMFEHKVDDYGTSRALVNPADGISLLLRTSGTTSRPKGVPLRQCDLITNGLIIASSMQLKDTDVCYSVMPLFHIGGISASVLCTLMSGGAICCDDETFDPSRMVRALATQPQPTWYSAVPTIHNATVAFIQDSANKKDLRHYGIKNGIWKSGHSLRMIRSGAAALLGPDADALSRAYGGVPIYPTYSMSEQMPISQPPAGFDATIKNKPGTVGVPVATSLAIVSRTNYRPLARGEEGEIAICGETVIKSYLENPEADAKSFFYLTLPGSGITRKNSRYFLTGDVGRLDEDGFLFISGRAKEFIKKGGEQVSPHEVEESLTKHPWVEIPLCFAVPSKVYGEEVGCAIVLSTSAPVGIEDAQVIKTLRKWLKDEMMAPFKYPTKWVVVEEKDLPRTSTKKLVRVNAASALGLDQDEITDDKGVKVRGVIDWGVISGFRFFLACYVMFMHIGSNESWGRMSALRGFPWHVHTFFTLGGFSLASPMNPGITKKLSYVKRRIGHMYPQYALALIFGLANLLVVCRPSTFRDEFNWNSQPDDLLQPDGSLTPMFCEGTPLFQRSYFGSLISTIIIYVFGLAVTPLWPLNWWLGYYLWFASMYYQCIAIFPSVYNYLYLTARKQKGFLLKIMLGLLISNAIIVSVAWFSMRGGTGYGHYDDESGKENDENEHTDGVTQNVAVLSFYLFAPFWALYFVAGAVLAFIYDAYQPADKHNARVWGYVADSCSLIQVGLSIMLVCDTMQTYGDYPEPKIFRPTAADQFTDSSNANRLWDNLSGRIMAPLTTLWIYSLSTGKGYTAKMLRHPFIVSTLAPLSYNCFLFHQMVAQWYFAVTREGHFWNWWRFRKSFYWFSPEPCPVEWFEYLNVVGIVCFFSSFVDSTLLPAMKSLYKRLRYSVSSPVIEDKEEADIPKTVCDAIEAMTGIEPDMDSSLGEVGLASVGIPVIVGLLNDVFSTKREPLGVTGHDLMKARNVRDIVGVIENAKERMQHHGF